MSQITSAKTNGFITEKNVRYKSLYHVMNTIILYSEPFNRYSQSSHTCIVRHHIPQNMPASHTAKCHKSPTLKQVPVLAASAALLSFVPV